MNPITHGLISWGIANIPENTTRRQRILVTAGGLIPDIDGLGMLIDKGVELFGGTSPGLYHEFHRVLGHNIGFAVLGILGAMILADNGKRLLTAAFVALTFHLHLLCDILGSRGPATDTNPGGDVWGIPYMHLPFVQESPNPLTDPVWWKWEGQWALNAWPNITLTLLLILFCGFMAVRCKRTIVEVLSLRLDGAVVRTLRARFAKDAEPAPGTEPAPRAPDSSLDPPAADDA